MNTPRHLTPDERKLITDTLRELLRRDPATGAYNWIDMSWSNERLTKQLNKTYSISPPFTTYNVQSIRQQVFGHQIKKRKKSALPKLPDIPFSTRKLAVSVSQLPLPLVPLVKPAQVVESDPPRNNFFRSVIARISDLERRVTELEDAITQPKNGPQRAPALDDLDEQFHTGCA